MAAPMAAAMTTAMPAAHAAAAMAAWFPSRAAAAMTLAPALQCVRHLQHEHAV